jgi:hypothetical protein
VSLSTYMVVCLLAGTCLTSPVRTRGHHRTFVQSDASDGNIDQYTINMCNPCIGSRPISGDFRPRLHHRIGACDAFVIYSRVSELHDFIANITRQFVSTHNFNTQLYDMDYVMWLFLLLQTHTQLGECIQVIPREPSNCACQSHIQTITTVWQLVFNLPHTLETWTNDQSLPSLAADNFHYSFHKYFIGYIYTCKTDIQVCGRLELTVVSFSFLCKRLGSW